MTLSTVQPTDQELNARWPYWIRTLAAAINLLESGVDAVTVTDLTIALGDTTLTVGHDLSTAEIELVIVTGSGAAPIQYIYNGTEGQIKIFLFLDGNITFVDGPQSGGQLYLNQSALTTINFLEDDIIVLANINGAGDDSNHGYWKELWRTLSVK